MEERKKMEYEGPPNSRVITVGDRELVICRPLQSTPLTEEQAWETHELLKAAKAYQEELLRTPKFPVPKPPKVA